MRHRLSLPGRPRATIRLLFTLVIPTLNEAPSLRRLIPDILPLGCPIVVSDGGSRDHTKEIAESHGLLVISGSPGRGRQLNRGAQAASSEALLFLHADTQLPPGALDQAAKALRDGAIGGGFEVRFDHQSPMLRLAQNLINRRTRATRCPLGDQAQFCCRRDFEALGGFEDWPILEDLNFVQRLKKRGGIAILDSPVTTSARRYRTLGVIPNALRNWLIFTLYFAGVSPHRLAAFYRPKSG